jgi:hypothetical protein
MRHLSFVLLLVSALSISSYGAARASDESTQSSPTTVNPSQFSTVTKQIASVARDFTDEEIATVALVTLALVAVVIFPPAAPVMIETAAHLAFAFDVSFALGMTNSPAPSPTFQGWSGGPSPGIGGTPAASSMPGITK